MEITTSKHFEPVLIVKEFFVNNVKINKLPNLRLHYMY